MDVVIAQSAAGAPVTYKIEMVAGKLLFSLGVAIPEGSAQVGVTVDDKAVLDKLAAALGGGLVVKAAEAIVETGLGIPASP